jgi:ATP-dependent exoDNAse (exonuclease V) beta subunit
VIQLDQVQLDGELTAPRGLDISVPGEAVPLDCILYPFAALTPLKVSAPVAAPQPLQVGALPDLVAPLKPPDREVADEKIRQRESDPPQRVWRVVSKAKRPTGPAWVVGKLVHEALRHWRFPGAGFDTFIRPFALEAGLTDPTEIRATIQEVRRLLERFRAHPLYAEIESAERYHEVPYVSPGDHGVIDLLYRNDAGWCLVDFKTDRVRSEREARDTVKQEGYDQQVQRYAEAVTAHLGQRPKTMILFLHVGGKVMVF